ncbi:hypothetical protein [Streptomyces sp.]|uniref:hypothetical protein n=1 Tax=Streptomyces sp. TaxID=1931 RepID=UPI002F9497ED
MGGTTIYLADGQGVQAPVEPRTWVDQSGTTRGDPLRAKWLNRDISSAVDWHRRVTTFQALRTTALSVPASTWTPVPLDRELIDTSGGHSDETNTSRWYSPTSTGFTDWWLVSGHVTFGGAAGGVRIAGLRVNGGGTIQEGMKVTATAAHGCSVQLIDLVEMTNSGSAYMELMTYQSTAGSVNTTVSGKSPSFTARWVSMATDIGVVSPAPATPRTWTSADVLSATDTSGGKIALNEHVRDVIRYLHFPPIARLTSQGTAQTIPTGTGSWTSITLGTETVDNYAGHSTVSNTSRYVCQRAGLYYVAGLASVSETAANVGFRAVRLLHTIAAGGTAVYQGCSTTPVTNNAIGTAIYATGWVRMAVGDYVEVQFQHTQGASLSVQTGAGNCSRLIAVWRRP